MDILPSRIRIATKPKNINPDEKIFYLVAKKMSVKLFLDLSVARFP